MEAVDILEHEELAECQIEFQLYRPLIKSLLKSMDKGIENLAKAMGLSRVTIYGYLGGKTPDIARCEFILKYYKNLVKEDTKDI